MNKTLITALALGLAAQISVLAAEPALYPTGPAEDASFIRFVNTLANPLEVLSGKDARVQLDVDNSNTAWQAVKARTPLKATLVHGGQSHPVQVTVQPSEFVTIAAIPDGQGGWKVGIGKESPSDFSAFKVSLGLMNLSDHCGKATIKLAGKDVEIIADVAPEAIKRRQINPVNLAVDLYCDGQRSGDSVDLGGLRAGERWTLLVHPSKQGSQLMAIPDRMP